MAEIPEHLLKRSRDAMARARGVPVDELLADAGGSPSPAAGAGEAEDSEIPGDTTQAASGAEPAAESAPAPPARAWPPKELVPAAGPRPAPRAPAWLTGVFLFVPILFVFLGLAVADVAEHSPAAKPARKAAPGKKVYVDAGCGGCHGANGEGASGPALNNVVKVFPDAKDQIAWVKDVAAATSGPYGASGSGNEGKGAGAGAMPAFGGQLSDDEIEQVVDFERKQFGGEKTAGG